MRDHLSSVHSPAQEVDEEKLGAPRGERDFRYDNRRETPDVHCDKSAGPRQRDDNYTAPSNNNVVNNGRRSGLAVRLRPDINHRTR